MGRIPKDIVERLDYFQQEVEELFRRMFEAEPGRAVTGETGFPAVDVFEAGERITVLADMPGVSREDMELFGAPNFVIFKGVKRTSAGGLNCLRLERTHGAFQRLVLLPSTGDPANIRATLDNGVLTVTVPKVVERRLVQRRIPIE